MRSILLGTLIFASLIASGLDAEPPETRADARWQTIKVGSQGDFELRFKVLREVTPADLEWMVFELENNGSETMKVDRISGYYRIETKHFDDTTSERISSDLGSGWLRLGGWIGLGKFRTDWQPGADLAALLGPTGDGRKVNATLHVEFEIQVGSGTFVKTPDEGLPFSFFWLAPTEERMRSLLHQWLYHTRWPATLGAHPYLEIPEIAELIPTEELVAKLLECLSKGSKPGSYSNRRSAVSRHLFKIDRATAVEYYTNQLKKGDHHILRELWSGWDDRLIEPLVALHRTDPMLGASPSPLDILSLHSKGWRDNVSVQKILATSLIDLGARLPEPNASAPAEELQPWRPLLEQLGKTHDRAAIPFLRQFLEVRLQVVNPYYESFHSFVRFIPVALRLCDVAHDAILRILERGSLAAAFEAMGYDPLKLVLRPDTWREDVVALMEWRDQKIADLEKRLLNEFGPAH